MSDEGVSETHALGRETVQVRSLKPRVAALIPLFALHDAQSVPAVVITDDEDEVGFAHGSMSQGGNQQAQR